MKTVGEILREERLKQGKTILEIHRETKIPEKTLHALETNDYRLLPELTFIKGFIQNYAKILGLDDQQLVAIFKRDFATTQAPKIIPAGFIKPLDQKNTFFSPATLPILIITILATIFLTFIGYEVKIYFSQPKLTIEQPKDNEQISGWLATVKGKTSRDASVYINEELINVDDRGNFSYELELFPGENTITVKAINRHKKETIVIKKVKKID